MAITFKPENSYPQNQEDGFPVGQSFYLIFSNAVDLKKFKECCVLFGRDFDRSYGPDNSLWLNTSDATNPFFLRSPGFGGFIDYDIEGYLIDDYELKNVLETQTTIEKLPEQKTLIKITPKIVLPENNKFQLYIIGSNADEANDLPEFVKAYGEGKSISVRTVYDVMGGNNEVDSRIRSSGSFEPKNNESSNVLYFKIVTAGEGSQAKYIWWFDDESEPAPADDRYKERLSRCVQRWRLTDRGVMLRFSGGTYELNELFKVFCYEEELLEQSYLITFQTSTDSVYEYPENVSASPIGLDNNIIPDVNSFLPSSENELKVISIEPYDGAINVNLDLKQIVITFNQNLNPETVTQENVKLTSYPVSGSFDGPNGTRSDRERIIYKIISVIDNKIILEI